MVRGKGKVVEVNARTGERKEYEQEFDFPDVPVEEPVGVDLNEVREMLAWFKKHVKPQMK